MSSSRFHLLCVSLPVWLGIVATGFFILAQEGYTPVSTHSVALRSPLAPSQGSVSTEPRLVMFVHPQCPCTRATLEELDRLMAEIQGKVRVTIFFTIPKGVPAGWERGALWSRASCIPGVQLVRDFGGIQAQRFGVQGSGHVLLYGPKGELLFSGGITPSRGHEGDSAGRTAIASLVRTGRASVSSTPVYGCTLL